MSCVEKVQAWLCCITLGTSDEECVEKLLALLPEDKRNKEVRAVIARLVDARNKWLNYDWLAHEWLSYDDICSQTSNAGFDLRDGALEDIKRHLNHLALLLGEEPPKDSRPGAYPPPNDAYLIPAGGCLMQLLQSGMVMVVVALVFAVAIITYYH